MTGFAIGLSGTIFGLLLGLLVATYVEPIRAFVSNVLNIPIFPPELFLMAGLPSRIDPMEVLLVVRAVARAYLPRDALSGLARGASSIRSRG